MTFVGKILVIVIMAFALCFLALSTVVFTASTNWRTAYQAQQKTNQELQQKVAAVEGDLARRKAAFDQEQQNRQAELDRLAEQLSLLTTQRETLERERTELATQVETAQQTALTTTREAEALAKEAETLREQFQAAQQQANAYAVRQTELNEQIFNLERQIETARRNNEDLRNAVASYTSFLESRGLPSDLRQVSNAIGDTVVAPDVEGRVLRVDSRNDYLEISIGADDGIVSGQEFHVFRTGDAPQYIARIKVQSTEPDKSVARVVFRNLGRKIQEGDDVAAQIQPRS